MASESVVGARLSRRGSVREVQVSGTGQTLGTVTREEGNGYLVVWDDRSSSVLSRRKVETYRVVAEEAAPRPSPRKKRPAKALEKDDAEKKRDAAKRAAAAASTTTKEGPPPPPKLHPFLKRKPAAPVPKAKPSTRARAAAPSSLATRAAPARPPRAAASVPPKKQRAPPPPRPSPLTKKRPRPSPLQSARPRSPPPPEEAEQPVAAPVDNVGVEEPVVQEADAGEGSPPKRPRPSLSSSPPAEQAQSPEKEEAEQPVVAPVVDVEEPLIQVAPAAVEENADMTTAAAESAPTADPEGDTTMVDAPPQDDNRAPEGLESTAREDDDQGTTAVPTGEADDDGLRGTAEERIEWLRHRKADPDMKVCWHGGGGFGAASEAWIARGGGKWVAKRDEAAGLLADVSNA